jgi:hypothetical protein
MSKYAEKKQRQAREVISDFVLPKLARDKAVELGIKKIRYVRNGHRQVRLGEARIAVMTPLTFKGRVLGYYGVGPRGTLFWREDAK